MTKKAVKRVQFIYFQPLRALFERDEETLSEQMKELKEELKIKITNNEFDVNDYVLDFIHQRHWIEWMLFLKPRWCIS